MAIATDTHSLVACLNPWMARVLKTIKLFVKCDRDAKMVGRYCGGPQVECEYCGCRRLYYYWYTSKKRMYIIDGSQGGGGSGSSDNKWNRWMRHLITTLHTHIFPVHFSHVHHLPILASLFYPATCITIHAGAQCVHWNAFQSLSSYFFALSHSLYF